jgi:hypothetical protein
MAMRVLSNNRFGIIAMGVIVSSFMLLGGIHREQKACFNFLDTYYEDTISVQNLNSIIYELNTGNPGEKTHPDQNLRLGLIT